MSDVVLCECFARDGLQNEPTFVPTESKVAAINAFVAAGFPRIEATSYSHPKHVPAFRDGSEVVSRISRREGVWLKATCPNMRAVERALADRTAGHGASEFSLLVSASESHTKRNLRTTRDEQWARIETMVEAASRDPDVRPVGVVSVAFGCPFEGRVDSGSVVEDVARFVNLGVRHVTIGDTTGLGTPTIVRELFGRVFRELPDAIPIAHFHDTRGAALANCLAAFDAGCRWFDSAMGGVGGHPAQITYGEGLTGNVATEDLVNLFNEEGVETGLDLDLVLAASKQCEAILGRELHSNIARSSWGLRGRKSRAHA